MFMDTGPHGPYYTLHNFKATDRLDTKSMKELRVAGTLRYRSKELQVMFGHVKKVFLDHSSAVEGRGVWLQASSGM